MKLIEVTERIDAPIMNLVRQDKTGWTIEISSDGERLYLTNSNFVKNREGKWAERDYSRIGRVDLEPGPLPDLSSLKIVDLSDSWTLSFSDMVAFTQMWPRFVELTRGGVHKYEEREVEL